MSRRSVGCLRKRRPAKVCFCERPDGYVSVEVRERFTGRQYFFLFFFSALSRMLVGPRLQSTPCQTTACVGKTRTRAPAQPEGPPAFQNRAILHRTHPCGVVCITEELRLRETQRKKIPARVCFRERHGGCVGTKVRAPFAGCQQLLLFFFSVPFKVPWRRPDLQAMLRQVASWVRELGTCHPAAARFAGIGTASQRGLSASQNRATL